MIQCADSKFSELINFYGVKPTPIEKKIIQQLFQGFDSLFPSKSKVRINFTLEGRGFRGEVLLEGRGLSVFAKRFGPTLIDVAEFVYEDAIDRLLKRNELHWVKILPSASAMSA